MKEIQNLLLSLYSRINPHNLLVWDVKTSLSFLTLPNLVEHTSPYIQRYGNLSLDRDPPITLQTAELGFNPKIESSIAFHTFTESFITVHEQRLWVLP